MQDDSLLYIITDRYERGAMDSSEDQVSVEMLANSLGSERNVVERIRAELAARGWSQAELSRRMEVHAAGSTGGAIHPVVLCNVLGGVTGRHVSIDQLVTLAALFEVTVAEMLLPPDAMEMAAVLRALADGPRLQGLADEFAGKLADAQGRVVGAMEADSYWVRHVADALEQAIREVESQGREMSDSFRCRFLGGVIDRHYARAKVG